MKGYRWFIAVFIVMLILYIAAEVNRPKPVIWEPTLSRDDKNPYGSFILYREMKSLFPSAHVRSYRKPLYDQLNDYEGTDNAYMILAPSLDFSREDVNSLLDYVASGNYAFLASGQYGKELEDSLQLSIERTFDQGMPSKATSVNFTNPALQAPRNYVFKQMTIDTYFSRYDTTRAEVLGVDALHHPNFIRLSYGEGAFFIHAAPLCFGNYFMLTDNNAEYTSKALSYLPVNVKELFWDEYYKLGPALAGGPLAFILNNMYLRWSFRVALLTLLVFILFEMKRRQKIIPVIPPLVNNSLDFIETVGMVYFNQHDNNNIAEKKISYFMENLRSSFFVNTSLPEPELISQVTARTGVKPEDVKQLFLLIETVRNSTQVSDRDLLKLNELIDDFYKQSD